MKDFSEFNPRLDKKIKRTQKPISIVTKKWLLIDLQAATTFDLISTMQIMSYCLVYLHHAGTVYGELCSAHRHPHSSRGQHRLILVMGSVLLRGLGWHGRAAQFWNRGAYHVKAWYASCVHLLPMYKQRICLERVLGTSQRKIWLPNPSPLTHNKICTKNSASVYSATQWISINSMIYCIRTILS